MTIFASTPPINKDPSPHLPGHEFFDRPRAHQANPILVAVRDGLNEGLYTVKEAAEYYNGLSGPLAETVKEWWYTADHVHHARRVLSRWLAVFA